MKLFLFIFSCDIVWIRTLNVKAYIKYIDLRRGSSKYELVSPY